MRVLVTGGGGFLGKSIVRQLLDRGDEVVTLARGFYPELLEWGAHALRGDITDARTCVDACDDCDAIIHTAARVGMWGPRAEFFKINVLGTQNMLDAARMTGTRDIVFTSSPSVTSDGRDDQGVAQKPYPKEHLAFYPETKALAEQRVLAAHQPDGEKYLRTISLRPHLVWGPGDPNLIPRLLERARRGRLKVVGDGTNRVDMTYIDNAAQAHLNALDALRASQDEIHHKGPGGKAYFISNNEPVVLWDWINGLLEHLGEAPVRGHVSYSTARRVGTLLECVWKTLPLSGEPPMTRFVANQLATSHWYDMTPAREAFGYVPKVSMKEGLERLLASL